MMEPNKLASGNTAKTADYYLVEETYYQPDVAGAYTRWHGQGARLLGLTGAVDKDTLVSLFDGKLPDGASIPPSANGVRRPGYDITFGAPKSFSQALLVGGDWRLMGAQQAAVNFTLNKVEEICAQARVSEGGVKVFKNMHNLTIACATHMTSRAGQPHLHDHALVINQVLTDNKVWRALATKDRVDKQNPEGFGENVYALQLFFGAIYHSELAKLCVDLGYSVETVGHNGLFELSNIPKAVRQIHSKRRAQIEEGLSQFDYTTSKMADIIAYNTRDDKEKIFPEELEARWRDDIKGIAGFDLDKVIQTVMAKTGDKPESLYTVARNQPERLTADFMRNRLKYRKADIAPPDHSVAQLLDEIILLQSQFQVSFTFEQLLHKALAQADGRHTFVDFKKGLEEKIKQGQLLTLDQRDARLTTPALVQKETQLIEHAARLATQRYTINATKLSAQGLTAQKLLSTRHQIVNANVASGEQKKLIKALVNSSEACGKQTTILVGTQVDRLSVSQEHAREHSHFFSWLLNQFKPERCQTIAGFSYQESARFNSPLKRFRHHKQCLIVESAERMSVDELSHLLKVSQHTGAKLIFLSDAQGRKAVSGGDALALLDKAGVKTVEIKSTHKPINLQVTLHDQQDLKTQVINCDDSLVVTDRKRRVVPLTQFLRDQAIASGRLSADEKTSITSLAPLFITKGQPIAYKAGQYVRIYHRHGGDFRVVSSNEENVVLRDERTQRAMSVKRSVLARQSLSLFDTKALDLHKGERLVATASDKRLGLIKGRGYTLQQLAQNQLVLSPRQARAGHDETLTVPLSGVPLPLKYDYVRTIHTMGREPTKRVLLDVSHYSVNHNLLYSAGQLSQGVVDVYTPDLAKASERLNTSQKKSAAMSLVIDRAAQLMPQRTILSDALRGKLAVDILTHYQKRSDAEKAIDFAVELLSERQAGFTYSDVMKAALSYKPGAVSANKADTIIQTRLATNQLIQGTGKTPFGTQPDRLYTTPKAVAYEEGIIRLLNTGIATQQSIVIDRQALRSQIPAHLTRSQSDAMQAILSSTSRFVAVQGFAGSGKSTLWQSIDGYLKTQHSTLQLLGLAPTHQGVKALRSKGIEAQTLQSFLVDQQKSPGNFSQHMIILDEASQVSNHNLHDFVNIVAKQQGRAVVQGDTLQYQAIEAGKPWDVVLAASDVPIIYNNEIVRQKTASMQSLVKATIKNQLADAMHILCETSPNAVPRTQPHLSQTLNTSLIDYKVIQDNTTCLSRLNQPDRQQGRIHYDQQNAAVIDCAVDDYLSRTPKAREDTYFIVATRDDMTEANRQIRHTLKQQGDLSRKGVRLNHLENLDLEKVKLTQTVPYKKNQVTVVDNQYYRIDNVDHAGGVVSLIQCETGESRAFMPGHYPYPVELYRQKPKAQSQLCPGERIRLTKTFKQRGVFANSRWLVDRIDEKGAYLKSLDGEHTHFLSTTETHDGHWDYDYTITGFSAQSASTAYGIGLDLAWHRLSETPRKWLVEVTRPEQHITVYTTDVNKLLDQLKTPANKIAAIEVKDNKDLSITLDEPVMPFSPEDQASSDDVKQGAQQSSIAVKNPADKPPTFVNQSSVIKKTASTFLEADGIKAAINQQSQMFAMHLLGEPNRSSTSTYLRYGKNDCLSVCIDGQHAGQWKNFKTGEGGHLINLVCDTLGVSFRDALQFAQQFVGGVETLPTVHVKPSSPSARQTHQETAHTQKMRDYANALIEQATSIKGTESETYLSARGIQVAAGKYVKHHPRVSTGTKNEKGKTLYTPALLVIASTDDQQHNNVQAILLNKGTGEKWQDPERQRPSKKTIGSFRNANNTDYNHVTIGAKKPGQSLSFVTEGVEDALTIKQAIGNEHIVAFLGKSNLANLNLKRFNATIVNVLDNDGMRLHDAIEKDPAIKRALSRQLAGGKEVYVTMPTHAKDSNELLQHQGIDAVKASLAVMHRVLPSESANHPQQLKLAAIAYESETQQQAAHAIQSHYETLKNQHDQHEQKHQQNWKQHDQQGSQETTQQTVELPNTDVI